MYLFINTSQPEADIGLLDDKAIFIDRIKWQAGHNQSDELLQRIDSLLKLNGVKKTDLSGILMVKGPGSYTGLRVGIASGNALALALGIGAVGIAGEETGDLAQIISRFEDLSNDFVRPFYANSPHITKPKL